VSGRVVKVNAALRASPELVNQEPYAGGWMIELEPTERGEVDSLLTHDAYVKLIENQ
jgi:glycine cleavage system H protein